MLRVQLNNVTLRSALRFEYRAPASLLELQPLVGPTDGGTLLIISGKGLIQTVQLYCKFQSGHVLPLVVFAHWVSDVRVECSTPANGGHGYASVELTTNDQQYTSDGLQFYYSHEIQLTDLWPTHGPPSGGTLVTISGQHFIAPDANLAELLCRFNMTFVPVLSATESAITCRAPPHAAGVADVRVTNNVQSLSTDMLMYEYQHVALLGAAPNVGPTSGGTLVLITGINLPVGPCFVQVW